MLDGEAVDDPKPLIIDFGHAQILADGIPCNCNKLSFGYSSPEQLEGKVHGFPSDVYGMGCCFSYIVNAMDPYYTDEIPNMLKNARNGKIAMDEKRWSELPQNLVDLIDGMIRYDPERRYTLDKCLEHPVFYEILGYECLINEANLAQMQDNNINV